MKKQRGIDEPVKPRDLECGCRAIGTGARAHLVLDGSGRPVKVCSDGLHLWQTLRSLSRFGVNKDLRTKAEQDMAAHLRHRPPKAAGKTAGKMAEGPRA